MKNMSDYYDENGIIIHKPGPTGDETQTGGGDSINREGHYWFYKFFFDKYFSAPALYKPFCDNIQRPISVNEVCLINWNKKAKCVIRHWKGYKKAFDPQYGTSRDQFMPIAISALLYDSIRGHKLFEYYQSRCGMMPNLRPSKGDWNGDILGFEHRSSLHRANPETKKQNTMMILGDIARLFSAVIRIFKTRRDHDDVGDSLNLNQEIILGVALHSNFITRFTAKIWAKHVYGGPQYQLDHYFRHDHAPPINELYEHLNNYFYRKYLD